MASKWDDLANRWRIAAIDAQWYVVDDTDHPQPIAVCRNKETAQRIVEARRLLVECMYRDCEFSAGGVVLDHDKIEKFLGGDDDD